MKRLRTILLGVGLLGMVAYRARRWLLAWGLRLPEHRYRVALVEGLRVETHDGLTLATDHYYPKDVPHRRGETPADAYRQFPTILIRSPYGRGRNGGGFGMLMAFFAHRFAERGYHVVVQDTRGRFDSDGEFDPYFNEKADGTATLNWLQTQPWFNGSVGLWGGSYLGIVLWLIAAESPVVKAIVPSITSSKLHSILFPDGAFDLGLATRWLKIFQELDRRESPFMSSQMVWRIERAVARATRHLPVSEADVVLLGETEPIYRRWVNHTQPTDPLWQEVDAAVKVELVTAPAHLIGGWYDFFLRGMLADYAGLRAAGRNPYLTIGPWFHFSAIVSFDDLREGLRWFDAHLKGDKTVLREKPVRVYVMGADSWREMDAWPPESTPTRYYLHPERTLSRLPPTEERVSSCYCYDPAKPTPIVGGAQFSPWAGQRDNRRLEARKDVLTFTSDTLREDLEIMGAVRMELFVRSSADYTDFLGRLCDVYPDGRSMNVCDGLFRVEPGQGERQPDGSLRIEIDLWATAYRFRRGHRLRVQVSSGAHPRWSRNLGVSNQLNSGEMIPAEQTVYHDRQHPSAIVIPVSEFA